MNVVFDGLRPSTPALPCALNLRWRELNQDLKGASVEIHGARLILRLFDTSIHPQQPIPQSGWPATLHLEGGAHIDIGALVAMRTVFRTRPDGGLSFGVQLEATNWHWVPLQAEHLVYVGALGNLVDVPGSNLVLKDGNQSISWGHFRGRGSFAWHLVTCNDGRFALAMNDGGRPLDSGLQNDLFALDFVAGGDINLPLLIAYGEDGIPRGALAPGRLPNVQGRVRAPVPNASAETSCWAAPLFTRLSQALAMDRRISIPVAGYLDALRGHIHGGYLLAQVALESFCAQVGPKATEGSLVASPRYWGRWIDSHRDEIRAFAATTTDGDLFVKKLKESAHQRPSGAAIERAFASWGLTLPKQYLNEAGKRNRSAHRYVMFDTPSDDGKLELARMDTVQTMLTAAIAKHIGYTGPIVGTEEDDQGRLLHAEFWTQGEVAEAQDTFICYRN